MRPNYLKTALFARVTAALVIATAYAQAQATPPAQGRGGTAQNLQVLPKTMTTAQVQQFMRSNVAPALGVECSHCHVGGPADRAKDDKPTKATARKMFQMTMHINDVLLKGVGDPPAAGASKVTCFTCHQGKLKPLTAPGGGN